jgi:predicted O-linked N-acetylglucosamine transferase (SPINDLY family)
VEPVRSGLDFRFARHDGDRLHIGYISADWCDSPVAHVACTMFGHHDREHFEVTVFATGPDDGSEFRPAIREGCDHFVDLFTLDSRAAAQKIFASGIDILVDMQGNTGTLPPVICALRPAPVQVLYLAYCGTTGSDWIDYLVADPIVVPAASRRHYSEALVLMPECFMAANDAAAIAETTPGRADEGLPDAATVFCSFANRYKISRDTFTLWMGILAAVPGSVLWLPGGSEVMTDNLCAAARGAGIDPDRVVFARRTASKAEHMARHRLADLFLDTPVYGAHVSGLDSLWAGVPLLTIQGNGFSSRVGASFLKQLGLEELITCGPDAYAELAIALGNDPARLAGLRGRVGQAVASGHLFDTGRWVRNLEKAYRALWKNHLAGAPPGTIEL